jgi:hypothetical protein
MERGETPPPMPKQRPLFGEPKKLRKAPGRPAPDGLTPPELRSLHDWAELNCPWLRREALESFERVETYVEEILDWWRGDGGLKSDWVATIRNRIRVVERTRLAELAKRGNNSARQALRSPIAWAAEYDRQQAASERVANLSAPAHLDPGGGGEIVHLGDRRGRPRR